ncbi:hypothetical protein [Marixanthomonas spongiae]|nr:hypothetical protein [Marixanthomonas spongiae]
MKTQRNVRKRLISAARKQHDFFPFRENTHTYEDPYFEETNRYAY